MQIDFALQGKGRLQIELFAGFQRAQAGVAQCDHPFRTVVHHHEDWRGGAELWAMQAIKRALDPSGALNPGKVLPPG